MPKLFDFSIVILGHQPKEIVTQVHKICESKMFAVSLFNFAEDCKQPVISGEYNTSTRSIRQLFKNEIVCEVCVCEISLFLRIFQTVFQTSPWEIDQLPLRYPCPTCGNNEMKPFFVSIRSKCFVNIPRNELKQQGSQWESLGLEFLPRWRHFRTACISKWVSFERCF